MPEFASKEDVQAILKAMGESTAAISNLAIKLEHQSVLIEKAEERSIQRIDKLEVEAKEDRKSAAASRKEMHKEIYAMGSRLIPVESMTVIIKNISTKIIGTLITLFITGGVSVYFITKLLGS